MLSCLKSTVSWPLRNSPILFRFVQNAAAPKISDEHNTCSSFEEQRVIIKSCGSLYEKWRKDKKFWKVPDGDLTFNVRYLDTGKGSTDQSAPILLALHGAPGTYKDFDRMTYVLANHGIRIIAPNFPDFSDYSPGIFRHSADEKAQYLKDFLHAINVNHLDLLLCHSSAVYPGLKLCVENKAPTISGLALFNPGAFHTSMRAIQPWFLLRRMVRLSEFPIGLQFMESLGPSVLKLVKAPVNIDNCLDPLLSLTVMTHGGILKSREAYTKLVKQRFPILLAFSENDKVMDKELSYKIAYKLGLLDSLIFRYNERGDLINEGKVYNNVKAMAFEKGSHYVLSKHSDVLNKEILKFLHEYVL